MTNNLFGDIVADLGAQIQGGIGLAASANVHPGRHGLFEPVHGSAPDIAGQGVANPLAALLTAGLMLAHLGWPELDREVQSAVQACLRAGHTTRELGGTLCTSEVTDRVIALLG